MIIGFSRYGIGGSGPVLDYLTGYLVKGEQRDPRPEVVRGDPKAVAGIIDSLPFQRRYSSGVLSFAAEDRVTPEIQEDIMNRFENAVFAGLEPNRRSIVWIKHQDKGRCELHFCAARVDLATGKSLNIAPPTPASRQLLDTLREGLNLRYGFHDPGDPTCAQSVSLPGHIAKLAAQARRLGRSEKTDIRQSITAELEEQARAGRISNRADVIRHLKEQGFSVTRSGVNYLTIVRPDTGERVRLKGNIFREHFCPRDLEYSPKPTDPARLLALDRRLQRLVEKRATYHHARYGAGAEDMAALHTPEELQNDRIGNPPAHIGSTSGEITPRPRTEVWGDALRLDEATQRFGRASSDLERAGKQLNQADRAFARDLDQAMSDWTRRNRIDGLVQVYGLPECARSLSRDIGLELEL